MVLLCAHFDATHSSTAAMRADHQITEKKRRARVEIELHVHFHVTHSCPAALSADVLTTKYYRNRSKNSKLMDTASRTRTKIVACNTELDEIHNCSLVSAKNCGKCGWNLTYVPVSNALRIIPCLTTATRQTRTQSPNAPQLDLTRTSRILRYLAARSRTYGNTFVLVTLDNTYPGCLSS